MFEVMKMSMYNFMTSDEDGNLIIYNFLHRLSSLTKVMKPDIEKFTEIFLNNTTIYRSSCEQYAEAVDHLLQSGILVDASVDERALCDAKYYQEAFDNTLVLVILTTGKCNFNCTYCYEAEKPVFRGAMSLESQKAVLKFIQKRIHNHSKLCVSWFGGEPLLEPRTIKYLSEKFIKTCNARLMPYSAQVTTNGFLLDADMFDMLYNLKVYTYVVTIDGFKEQHDKLRFTHDGKGTYDVILSNLLRIRDSKKYRFAHINIRVNITRGFLGILDDFMDTMNSLFGNDPRFSFTFVPAEDYSKDHYYSDMFVDNSEVTSRLLANEIYTSKFYPERYKKQLIDPEQGCIAGQKNTYVIAPDLKVYKCCVHYDMEENYIGQIDLNGNLLLDESVHSKWYLLNKLLNKTPFACRDCFYKPVCPSSGRGCPSTYLKQDSSNTRCPLQDHSFVTALTESILYTTRKYPYTVITL